eukprot:5230771-Pleurochrysis_carterae.AAC.3
MCELAPACSTSAAAHGSTCPSVCDHKRVLSQDATDSKLGNSLRLSVAFGDLRHLPLTVREHACLHQTKVRVRREGRLACKTERECVLARWCTLGSCVFVCACMPTCLLSCARVHAYACGLSACAYVGLCACACACAYVCVLAQHRATRKRHAIAACCGASAVCDGARFNAAPTRRCGSRPHVQTQKRQRRQQRSGPDWKAAEAAVFDSTQRLHNTASLHGCSLLRCDDFIRAAPSLSLMLMSESAVEARQSSDKASEKAAAARAACARACTRHSPEPESPQCSPRESTLS